MDRKYVGVVFILLVVVGFAVLATDAAISVSIVGGPVDVSNALGDIEYMMSPFTDWRDWLEIQSGAEWHGRVYNLTMMYAGPVNVTWSLWSAGNDGVIDTGDDVAIPTASFVQTITVVSGVGMNVTASSDGFNPYNWGQWTTSSMRVYLKADLSES